MIRVTRRYQFSASHRLHSHELPEEENRRLYGKCNNPFGHGHNYEVEITLSGPVDERTGRVADLDELDRLVQGNIIGPFQHRNLNEEVEEFRDLVPTTENLTAIIERRLRAVWPSRQPALERVRIFETARNIFEI